MQLGGGADVCTHPVGGDDGVCRHPGDEGGERVGEVGDIWNLWNLCTTPGSETTRDMHTLTGVDRLGSNAWLLFGMHSKEKLTHCKHLCRLGNENYF